MNTRSKRRIVVGTIIAGALSWSLPAAAADNGAPAVSDAQVFGITGRTLNEGEMSDLRGTYTPGSRVNIRVNGTEYTDSDPAPGSSSVTVNLGPGSVSRGFASTTGTSGSSRVSITLSGVTLRTSGGP
jgi:hypothetical protein